MAMIVAEKTPSLRVHCTLAPGVYPSFVFASSTTLPSTIEWPSSPSQLCVFKAQEKSQRRACINSRILYTTVASPCQTFGIPRVNA